MKGQQNTDKKLITRQQATKRYAVSLRHLDGLICAGVIPSVRLGKRCIRIPVEKADASIESLTIGGRG